MSRKVLISLPDADVRRIDAAARSRGETRSAFLRRAALRELDRPPERPGDDPRARRMLALILRRSEQRSGITTEAALAARDKGRR